MVVVVHLVLLMGMAITTKTTMMTARVLPNDNDSFEIPFAAVLALHVLDATMICQTFFTSKVAHYAMQNDNTSTKSLSCNNNDDDNDESSFSISTTN